MTDSAQAPVPDTPQVVTPVPEPKKPNAIIAFLTNMWTAIEKVDAIVNDYISKITNGHSTLVLVVAAIGYWLVKPFIGFILTIPATLIKVILNTVAVIVPLLFQAVPYVLGVALLLLLAVEVVNLLKKLIK